MKLFSLFMIIGFLQLHAKGVSQKVTLDLHQASLSEAFKEIKKQTGYVFWFDEKLVRQAQPVSVSLNDVPLEQALQACLKDQKLSYAIEKKVIVITAPRSSSGVGDFVPPVPIRIRVVDADGNPLSGASIINKNTGNSGVTDAEGISNLNVSVKDVLDISFVGYESQSITVKDDSSTLTIVLKPSDSKLEEVEVVSTGYWTTTKATSTGNISRVTAEDIQKQPVSSPLQALIGRMPGVYVQQNSGVPGSSFNIQIRGRNSIRDDGNNPLYIVDGVPFTSTPLGSTYSVLITGGGNPLNNLNPSDIESIEVLKDADATAVYGSRGANGVVLITTKKGRIGKTEVDINIYQGVGKVTRMMNMLNTQQYLEMRHEAFRNDETTPSVADYDLVNWDTTRYTDWQKELIGGTAYSTNAQASISGGNANTQFLIGGGYYKETTVFPGDFADQKYSTRFNISHNSNNNKFRIAISGGYLVDNNNLLYEDLTSSALTLVPVAPALYDSIGNLNWEDGTLNNPLANLQKKFKSRTGTLVSNVSLNYEVVKELMLKVNLGYTETRLDEVTTNPITSFNPSWGVKNGYSTFAANDIRTWIIEPQINYQTELGPGKLSMVAGITFQQNKTNSIVLNASGYTSDALLDNIQGASNIVVNSANNTLYKYNAAFGRINYDLYGKYFINLTGRRDGSSRFGPGKQFANFGAFGIAWIFSKENLISQNSNLISFGKLRTSYGTTGSDQIGDYGYYDLWKSSQYSYGGSLGLYPNNLFNPNFAWEINRKFEVGIELGFFKDRVFLAVNYYHNKSSNQLVGYSLPSTTGFSSIQSNLPAEVQNTGMELELTTMNIQNGNFKWTSSLNVTLPRNALVSFSNISNSPYAYQYEVGKPLSIIKTFHYTGVDPQTGIYTFEDVDNNGSSTDYDKDLQAIKKVSQDFYGGVHNTISYKKFQLDIFFQFVKQTGRNYLATFGTPPGGISNQPDIVMGRWQEPGDVASIQKFVQTYNEGYFAYATKGDNTIGDASFIRLKTLSLSYLLPAQWSQKVNLQRSRIYLQGQNLFTITNYLGMDPESQKTQSLPPLRMLTFGINLTF